MTPNLSLPLFLKTFHLSIINFNPVSTISSWMTANLLTLNPSYTEFMLIGLSQQLSKIHSPALFHPPAQPILPCSSARNLGFVFHSSLSFSQQISKLSSSCHYHIRDLRRIRYSLDHKTAATIATYLVHSHLDYCNSLYYSLPISQLHRLQLIQNALAGAVSQTPLHSPISPVLHSLHWLKIEHRIQYKIISITYNLLHSATSSYLYRLLNIQPTRPTCSSNCFYLANPKLTSRLKFSDRSFRNAAPSLWNKLPTTLDPSPQKQLMPTQYHSHHLPYLINNSLGISKHIFSLSPFLSRLLLSPLPSTFSTSHCPFLAILLSAREYTSISWFCGHYNLLLSIYLSICSPLQSAYRSHHSTKTALIRVVNDIF